MTPQQEEAAIREIEYGLAIKVESYHADHVLRLQDAPVADETRLWSVISFEMAKAAREIASIRLDAARERAK